MSDEQPTTTAPPAEEAAVEIEMAEVKEEAAAAAAEATTAAEGEAAEATTAAEGEAAEAEAKAEEAIVNIAGGDGPEGDDDAEAKKKDVKQHLLEAHGGAGADFVKSIVFGGLDGIITTFAIVAAVAGASLSTEVIIMMGFSNLIADAISMGVGDFLSSKAENEYIMWERQKEVRECETDLEGEKSEMIEIYESKGFSKADATAVMDILTKDEYRDFFVDHMMIQELDKQVPDPDDNPAKDGLVTFASFIIFGSVPMWFYVFFHVADWSDTDAMFAIACVATACTMFALGAFKAQLTQQPRIKSGALMMFNGVLAAASAYLVGWGLENLMDVRDNCAA